MDLFIDVVKSELILEKSNIIRFIRKKNYSKLKWEEKKIGRGKSVQKR